MFSSFNSAPLRLEGLVKGFGSVTAVESAARAALGWVPQELAVYPRLTSRENLDAFGRRELEDEFGRSAQGGDRNSITNQAAVAN
jgi:ABC-type multidrug transport system ATPase subunit